MFKVLWKDIIKKLSKIRHYPREQLEAAPSMNKPAVLLLALLSVQFVVQTQAQGIVNAIVKVETFRAEGKT